MRSSWTASWHDYNKQIGNALEFKHVDRKTLERIQLLGYVKVFLYNGRILDFIRFAWEYRGSALAAFLHLFRRAQATPQSA